MSEDEWDDRPKVEDFLHLVGKSYTFEDRDSIEIIQLKRRDDGPWVTVHITQGPGIPRKLVMRIDEFLDSYGHLFEITE